MTPSSNLRALVDCFLPVITDYSHCISLQIRQRRTEEHFTAALKDQGTHQHIRTRLESFTLEESAENGYPVTVQARNLDNNEPFEIKT